MERKTNYFIQQGKAVNDNVRVIIVEKWLNKVVTLHILLHQLKNDILSSPLSYFEPREITYFVGI